ncbi:RHS repeat domain-containing protein [Streptomyces sp. NPDC007189]|uniref:RHS repeat domain-containing protein n=1 Tax=unclassified Streptomyces TaxID=2593676 RepID=UPI00340508AD
MGEEEGGGCGGHDDEGADGGELDVEQGGEWRCDGPDGLAERATRTTTWSYNAYDQLAAVTDAATRKTTYGYDAYGNRNAETDPDGNTYAYD